LSSLKKQAASGARWTTASTVTSTALNFLRLAILARLLSPQDFGLMAMIMVVIGFAQAYADMGISNAIIYRQDATRDQLSSLYWLNIIAGVAVFIIVLAANPLIVAFYKEPRLASLLPWAALVYLVTPIGQQFQILLQKNLLFRPLAIIEMISAICGLITAVGFALAGAGVFSLILGQLADSGIRALSLAGIGLGKWRPRIRFNRSDLQGYLGFGFYQMGERSISYLNSNLDKLLIGSLLGAQALGYYSVAWNLAIQPVVRINPIITKVAFPIFAKVQRDVETLRKGYLSVLKMLSSINFPLLVGMAATAPVFIAVVFGQEWLPAVFLLRVLAFVALLRSMGNPVGSLLLAKGRADLAFKWNVMLFVTQLPGVYLGVKLGGMPGVALALIGLQICYFYPSYRILVQPLINCTLRDYLTSMSRAFIYSLIMGGAIIIVPHMITFEAGILFAGQVMEGALLYFILMCVFDRRYIIEMSSLFFKGI